MPGKNRQRSRRIAFDEIDEALLSLALIERFPTAIFLNGGRPPERPQNDPKGSIPDCRSPIIDIYIPEEGWVPKFECDSNYPRWFNLLNPPKHVIFYVRSVWSNNFEQPPDPRWAFSWPTLDFGTITTNICADDLQETEYLKALWQIIGKLSATKYCKGYFHWKTTMKEARTRTQYVGNHALAWCLEGDRRMVSGFIHPCSDWQPAHTNWHRDLHARFEEWRKRWPGGVVPKLPSDRSESYE